MHKALVGGGGMGGGNGCLRLHFEQFEGASSTCFKLFVDQQKVDLQSLEGGQAHPLHPFPMGLIADKIYYHA